MMVVVRFRFSFRRPFWWWRPGGRLRSAFRSGGVSLQGFWEGGGLWLSLCAFSLWGRRKASVGCIPDSQGFRDESQIELVVRGVADKEFGYGGEAFEDEGLFDEHADGLGDMGGALPGPVEGMQGDMGGGFLEGGGEVWGAAAAVAGVRVP